MTQVRVFRRASQAEERVRLGGLQRSSPAAPPPDSTEGNRTAHERESQQAIQQSLQEMAQLRSQLERIEEERRQLRVTLENLQREIASARDAASQQGYEEGLRRAQAQTQHELTQCAAQWQESIEDGSRRYDARVQALRGELAEVVMASVTKLLGDHLINPQSIRATIEQTLRESGITSSAKVLLAPAQYEQLARFGANHLASLRERRIEVGPDPRVASGGCLIEMASGLVDGRFEVQLARLKELLANHYGPGSAGK